MTPDELYKTDRKRLIKQFFCSHPSRGAVGYEELFDKEHLPPGWIKQNGHAWSPITCAFCGYIFADMRDHDRIAKW